MKHLITIPFLFFYTVGISQEWVTNKENLNGNVKSVIYESAIFSGDNPDEWLTEEKEESYTIAGFVNKSISTGTMMGGLSIGILRVFDEGGKRCLVEYSMQDGDTTSHCNFEFDNSFRVIKSKYYNPSQLWNNTEYVYNEQGLLTTRIIALVQNKDTIWERFTYDKAGNRISYSHESRTSVKCKSWEYNENGFLLSEKSEVKKAPPAIVYDMGSNGNVIDKKIVPLNFYDEDNYIIHYSINDKGQILSETKTHLDDSLILKITFNYNQQGDVSIRQVDNIDTAKNSCQSFSYKYDTQGNWITKVTKWNDRPFRKEEREITYY